MSDTTSAAGESRQLVRSLSASYSSQQGSTVIEGQEKEQRPEMGQDKSRVVLVLIGVALVMALAVILALCIVLVYRGLESRKCEDIDPLITPSYTLCDSAAVTEGLSGIRRENLKHYHRFFAEKPHPSGSERDGVDIVNYLEASLRESGFDEVKKVPYLLLHPVPDPDHPNSVRLTDDHGAVLLEAKMTEDQIPGIDTDIGPAYLAFSGRGTVESQYVGGSAMERGSLDFSQDSETPGYASIHTSTSGLSKIPAQVIGYDDARVLLNLLGGKNWTTEGGFNFTYRTGPFASNHTGKKVRLSVNNIVKRLVVHDVIGIIRGKEEPGQFSVTGNHHDAWGFGASDPSSGTAALLETSRTLGDMVRRGWRPRRSIVIAFWAQEEMGNAGSREWVEFPVVEKTCGHAANNDCQEADISSHIALPGSAQDNVAFNIFAGIPSVDISFKPNPDVDGVSKAPSYHTAYDTLELYQKFVDQDYAMMERCSQLVGALTLSLAEAELLPYNMVDLGQALQDGFGDLQPHMKGFGEHNVSIGWLGEEIDLFVQTADSWHKWISDRKSFNLGTLRVVNERMMLVERAFIKPDGLMGNPTVRNLALGDSMEGSNSTVVFAALRLQLYYAARMKHDSSEAALAWVDIARLVNDITLAVRSARMMLDPN
ncbi:hypothetical protein HPB47_012868 [Ixodes persulcatus]|uniref:Uncharacterized protein n=1 Tax=Ixodes persulcatus TaxID=34615 RepID=A0AC60NSB9_IXOPE|nr:hypothetical protein HPB47_012868 [Ixodes persulcatus]